MLVTYRIKDELPQRSATNTFAIGMDVTVTRDCDLGAERVTFHITQLSDVPTVAAAVLAWIAADTAKLVVQLGIITTNKAIQSAFELAIGSLEIQVNI